MGHTDTEKSWEDLLDNSDMNTFEYSLSNIPQYPHNVICHALLYPHLNVLGIYGRPILVQKEVLCSNVFLSSDKRKLSPSFQCPYSHFPTIYQDQF